MIGTAKNIHAHKGFRGFYYGLPAVMTQVSMKAGIRFTAFETYRPIVRKFTKNESIVNWLSGTGAGITEAALWVTPTERLKVIRNNEIQSANPRYTTLLQTFRIIIKEQGPQGLWVGCVPTANRAGLCVGLRFMIYHRIVDFVTGGKPDEMPFLHSVLSGFITGCTSTCISNPLDVLKSRIQRQGVEKEYTGIVDALRKTVRHEGFRALYKGLPARVSKIGCGQAITFSIYGHISLAIRKVLHVNTD